MTQTPPATVATPAEAATVVTTVVKRRPFKILLVNLMSAFGAGLLLILDYLKTVPLTNVLSPEKVLLWTVLINVLTIVLRQFFTPTETVQTAVMPNR